MPGQPPTWPAGWNRRKPGSPAEGRTSSPPRYGGFLRLRFRDPGAEVESLRLDPAFVDELQRRMILCYTGASRFSGGTITRVMQAYERGDRAVTGALQALRDIAERMSLALASADLAAVGRLLSENWGRQQELDPGMCTPEMSRLDAVMRSHGALGGKASGSGAGGCMFFLGPDDARPTGMQRVRSACACCR